MAVAEKNGDLFPFLRWCVCTNQGPNVTSLGKSGLPSGRGRKGGVPKRKRGSRPLSPGLVVPRVGTQAYIQPSASSTPTNPSIPRAVTIQPSVSSTPASQSLIVQDCSFTTQVNAVRSIVSITPSQAVSISPLISPVFRSSTPVVGPVSGITIPSFNTNPFFVRQICGNIRICQGCRGSLRSASGQVHNPLFSMAVARLEKRQFRDKNGEIRTPQREQPSHYHLQVSCVKIVAPSFIPANVEISDEIRSVLTTVHKEYLRLMFDIHF